jgi:hypothetical protein
MLTRQSVYRSFSGYQIWQEVNGLLEIPVRDNSRKSGGNAFLVDKLLLSSGNQLLMIIQVDQK